MPSIRYDVCHVTVEGDYSRRELANTPFQTENGENVASAMARVIRGGARDCVSISISRWDFFFFTEIKSRAVVPFRHRTLSKPRTKKKKEKKNPLFDKSFI